MSPKAVLLLLLALGACSTVSKPAPRRLCDCCSLNIFQSNKPAAGGDLLRPALAKG
jgi:hypothetical protein